MKQSTMLSVLFALLVFVLTLGTAQEKGKEMASSKSGFRAEVIKNLAEVEAKLVSLAEATPADKFGWRPAEGVRSIAEVYMHIAGSNYYFPSFAGVKSSAKGDEGDKITDKAKIVEALKASFAFVKQAIMKTSDADLEKRTKVFGQDANYREVYTLLMTHAHEHMGQSIAYARMNGIVPPWSAKGM